MIRRTAEAVAAAGFAEVLVVTGAEHAAIVSALEGLACRIIHAEGWEEGMAASLRTGIAALSKKEETVTVHNMNYSGFHGGDAVARTAEFEALVAPSFE